MWLLEHHTIRFLAKNSTHNEIQILQQLSGLKPLFVEPIQSPFQFYLSWFNVFSLLFLYDLWLALVED
ncbi:unnamed protein product, partial [Vitis vinifera]